MGHLRQGRFASCALDGPHLVAAVRYDELNPVRARLADRADAWSWSRGRAHLAACDDGLVTVAPSLDAVGDWSAYLAVATRADEMEILRLHQRTGRPLGDSGFLATLEEGLGRRLRPGRPGRRRSRVAEPLNA